MCIRDRLYSVAGIPTLILLDGKGEVMSKEGVRTVLSDPRGHDFPYTRLTLSEAIGDKLIKGDAEITTESVASRPVGLYFSAHWCPPCKRFTPKLAAAYKKLQSEGTEMEIIFVSSDKTQAQFDEYRAEMPWVAMPYANRKGKASLADQFEVSGIPRLVILESLESGRIINPNAAAAVMADVSVENFPWHPPTLNDFNQDPSKINEVTAVVAMLHGLDQAAADAAVEAVRTVSEKKYAEARAAGKVHPDVRYYFSRSDAGPSAQIRSLSKTAGPKLLIVDIPQEGAFYEQDIADGVLTVEAIEAMLAGYETAALVRKQLG